MNGALTIGTLDGANVEIREEVGADNFFLFGLTADEVEAHSPRGYRPRDYYDADPELRARSIDLVASGLFSRGDRELFRPLVDNLLRTRPLPGARRLRAPTPTASVEVARSGADQERVDAHVDPQHGAHGQFSSDRSIREYCRDIWHVEPYPVDI